jgi:hypothetical protein
MPGITFFPGAELNRGAGPPTPGERDALEAHLEKRESIPRRDRITKYDRPDFQDRQLALALHYLVKH